MKTFKEYAWIPTALKVGKDILTHVVTKVNPSSAGAGSAVINKGYNWAKKKYKNRVVRGVKMKKTNEDMTAADAGLPVPDKGPRKKKKDLMHHIYRRKLGVVGTVTDGRYKNGKNVLLTKFRTHANL